MGSEYWEHVARNPRHPATGTAPLQVEIQRSAGKVPVMVEGELIDLSRDGVRLRTKVRLSQRESITVRLRDGKAAVDLTIPGAVRWQRPEPDGTWSLGCALARPVDWEALGELFLGNVLAMDDPAAETLEARSGEGPNTS